MGSWAQVVKADIKIIAPNKLVLVLRSVADLDRMHIEFRALKVSQDPKQVLTGYVRLASGSVLLSQQLGRVHTKEATHTWVITAARQPRQPRNIRNLPGPIGSSICSSQAKVRAHHNILEFRSNCNSNKTTALVHTSLQHLAVKRAPRLVALISLLGAVCKPGPEGHGGTSTWKAPKAN